MSYRRVPSVIRAGQRLEWGDPGDRCHGPGAWLILDERTNVDDGSARIELRRKSGPSLWAVVDLKDYERVNQFRWHALRLPHTTYAQGRVRVDGQIVRISMHRFVMNPDPELDVDHVDHDGLNNQRSNLRVATRSMNLGNMQIDTRGSSRYKGVHFEKSPKRAKRWSAQISVHNERIHLGRFYTEVEAAIAYDEAARRLRGEFALVNFPDLAA